MDVKTKEMYSEVYGVLVALGEKWIQRIPNQLWQSIQDNRLEGYNPEYSVEKSLVEQGIKHESLSMIALFHLNYWCENEEQKNTLKMIFDENTQELHEKMSKQYSSQNMFAKISEARNQQKLKDEENEKASKKAVEEIMTQQSAELPQSLPQEGFIQRFFKNIFKKFFKK